jgi:hypothetical protein
MEAKTENLNGQEQKAVVKKTVAKKTSVAKKLTKKSSPKKPTKTNVAKAGLNIIYPKHALAKALRIPKAIIEQNAGRECSERESATFVGVGYTGPYGVEISSAKKFGLLERTAPQKIKPTELAKRILRPQNQEDELIGYREAVINAPLIGDVYKHYRGENLPDRKFFENALIDTFKVTPDRVTEFIEVFTESLTTAKLLEKSGDKTRIIDISSANSVSLIDSTSEIKKLGKGVLLSSADTCFVMMPFSLPIGNYYNLIYEPAIRKAGLNAIRADNDIFGTGKIIDQIWNGISSSKVLIAELTQRNPNVYYELGIAHALKKPVVLVCSNEEDVPFDLKHIRVIYYDLHDPFWGTKLIDKLAENILSAIKNPEEAILFS